MALTQVLIYAIIALISAALYFIHRHLNYWKDRGIPHDAPSLLQGNMQGLMRTRSFGQIYEEMYFKFKGTGPFVGFHFFTLPAVMVLDIDLVKNVLIKDFSNFTDRGMYSNEKDDPLTGHLFVLDGQKWRNLRNKLSPAFTSGKMKFMYPTMLRVADHFVEVFTDMVGKNATVEIKELLARFTTDIIGSCAFGIDCNSLNDPNAEFRVMGRRSLTDKRHNAIITGFVMAWPKMARKLGVRITTDDVQNFFIRIVRETVKYREQNNVQANDFVSLMMEIKQGDKTNELRGLTIEEMAAQAFVFFIGGFETSSTTMGYALYELALNQDVQDKLRQEVNDSFAKYKEFSYECMQNMPYMDQVISETLRKYTIVPHLNRQALEDYVVPGHPNYVIKAGTPVVIPAIGIHHDPDIYPDPLKFDPERFSPEMVKSRESVEWLPFGDGPRNCIGMRFGKMQTRVGLAYLLQRFKFSASAKTEIPIIMDPKSFLVNSLNGIFLKVEKVQ